MKSLTVYTFARYPNNDTGDRFQIGARDPNGLWCIEMANVPNHRSVYAEDDDDEDEYSIYTHEFYLTADFDQNLTLLQKQRSYRDAQKTDLLQISASTFLG